MWWTRWTTSPPPWRGTGCGCTWTRPPAASSSRSRANSGAGCRSSTSSVDGVRSITIDPHKYGLANVPAGAILFRDQEAYQADSFFLDTPAHTTLLGTRPGSAAVATYAVLEHLGREGFVEITRTNFENTEYLTTQLTEAGYGLLIEPDLNIVVARVPHAAEVSRRLDADGWIVSTSKRFDEGLRLVVARHVTRDVIDAFMPALVKADHEVRAEVAG